MEDFKRNPHIVGRGFSIGRVVFDRPTDIGRHAHLAANLVLVYGGSWHDYAGRSLELKAGDILFQPANTVHEHHAEQGSEIIVADLQREFVCPIRSLYGDRPGTLRYSFDAFDDLPSRLYEEVLRNDAPSAILIEALLMQMLAGGARLSDNNTLRPAWLSRVTTHIHTHAHQPLSVAILADLASVSQSRLSHGFRKHMGKSIMAYIREYRLRIASRALRQTTRSIKDIALTFGFYDHAHFSREFARMYGVAPVEYRRRSQLEAVHNDGGSPPTAPAAVNTAIVA